MTRVSIQFQYKDRNQPRPLDQVQMERLDFEVPYGESVAALPIPAVGDTVNLRLLDDENPGAFKVITRHFSYWETESVGLQLTINIVVTDVEPGEMAARLKE
jgi:hypothetical protein